MPLDLSSSSAQITRTLCDIDSVSGNEKHIVDVIENAIRPYPHLEVIRDGDAIVAKTNGARDHRVVIAGHIDTVPVNNNLPTRFETVDGVEYLWGRGTVDMKAGVAVQLKLAAELVAPRSDVTWIWYDHEEVSANLNGLNRISRTQPHLLEGDFAILGEPSNGVVEGGCNGSLRVEVRTCGVRAHSARSWVGENAIHGARPILHRLAEYVPRVVLVDGLNYREGVNAVGISGGVATNVIPDECVVTVNYRFAPNQSSDEAAVHMRELFEGFDVTVVDVAEGARPGLDSLVAREFVDAAGGVAYPKYGWTDVARFSALGVPAVNFGPGDPMLAHADNERVRVDQIADCERVLRTWLTR